MTGLVAHEDEAAPHAHFWLDSFDRSGKAVSRLLGRSGSKIQDIAAEAARPAVPEIERGRSKKSRVEAGEDPADPRRREAAGAEVAEIERRRFAGIVSGRALQNLRDSLAERTSERDAARVRAAKAEADLARAREDLDAALPAGEADELRKSAAGRLLIMGVGGGVEGGNRPGA